MRYQVEFHMEWVKFEVEADSEDDAETKVKEAVYITSDLKDLTVAEGGEFEVQEVYEY